MNSLPTFALFIIIFLLPLSRLSYTVAGQHIDVQVHNSFSDGREVILVCLSRQPSVRPKRVARLSLAEGEHTSWTIRSWCNRQRVDTCSACWRPQRYIQFVRYEFKAFESSWRHDVSIKDPETRELKYSWMLNGTGLFCFDYHTIKYKLVVRQFRIMETSIFYQEIAIYVVNGFDDGRVISIFHTENPSASQSASSGGFGRWTINKFSKNTQQIYSVTWTCPNGNVALYTFEAFSGRWSIDAKVSVPSTFLVKFEWFINDTGLYLFDFVNDCYEIWRSLELN